MERVYVAATILRLCNVYDLPAGTVDRREPMKTRADPILEEMWRIKDAAGARFGTDVHAAAEELRRQQSASGRKILTLPARPARRAETKR
jgi:hypothetical protein